jgi:hypothetical protein
MGNRAVITFKTNPTAPCIYLHWNGGRASVEGFLRAAKALGIEGDHRERMDALADVLARAFFKNPVGMNVYREEYGKTDTDNWDNGVYVIDDNWEIVDRLFKRHGEEINPKKTKGIAESIIENIEENA